jgi:hypothetical protein
MKTWTDDDIERNITSSDVEFLEGTDMTDATTSKEKDKPETVNKEKTTPERSGVEHKADSDVDMQDSDIMSVLDQIFD